ncbi:MAG: phosphoribosylformylglycinamidine cyclo-ligase [bacterium]
MKYSEAGVDTRQGRELVERIRSFSAATIPEPGDGMAAGRVLTGLGGFGALYQLGEYRQPVLVSGTDGVGTKLQLAVQSGRFKSIGIDCVAMCVNDILCHGARPLFFLDYLAHADLPTDSLSEVVAGISEGCQQSGCALIGGETAQMPGTYRRGDFDVAGFAVGVVERDQLVDGSDITEGDHLIGLAASGLHSNGFSLVRALLSAGHVDLAADFYGRPLIEELLTPTRIYLPAILPLVEAGLIKGMAHITGGGLYENLPRMFQFPQPAAGGTVHGAVQPGGARPNPAPLGACLAGGSWHIPPIFEYLEQLGVARREMLHTFNMGIGFVVAAAPDRSEVLVRSLEAAGFPAGRIGRVVAREGLCFE